MNLALAQFRSGSAVGDVASCRFVAGHADAFELGPMAAAPRQAIKLDPSATYTLHGLIAATGWSMRSIQRWRKLRRGRMPAPFYPANSRVPHWQGRTILNWMEREQREANGVL